MCHSIVLLPVLLNAETYYNPMMFREHSDPTPENILLRKLIRDYAVMS